MSYSAKNISRLKGLDAVRKLPGMYIGNNSVWGLHHLLKEIFSNSADEVMNGHGSLIRICLAKDGSATVWDDGRGIPVEWKRDTKMSALTQVLTILHAGGKFAGDSAYASSGGLHGVGAKAANAMSRQLTVTVRRGGMIFRQDFQDGGLYSKGVQIINPGTGKAIGEITAKTKFTYGKNGRITAIHDGSKKLAAKPDAKLGTGTEVAFLPNREWFDKGMEWNGVVPWEYGRISTQYQQIAYLSPGLRIEFEDLRGNKPRKEIFYSKNGIVDYIELLNEGLEPAHKTICFKDSSSGDTTVEVAMQYTKDGEETQIYSFVNGIPTPLGGTHVSGFQTGLTTAVNKLANTKSTIKGEDLLLGLTAVINITMNKTPQFSSQTKDSLTTAEVRGVVQSATYAQLQELLGKQKSVVNAIAKQADAAAKGREAAKKARQLVVRKSVLDAPDDAGLLSKLADTARATPVEQRILFLVEGDSAGGTCKQGRDRRYHAILASRGKIINAEKVKLLRVLGNNEIKAFVAALGAGVSSSFDAKDRRYGRVAILADADVDGFHIRALWYTFIWKHMRSLITEGHLYIAEAPLYRVHTPKKSIYCYTEKERELAQKKLGTTAKMQRYKGLGEMNAEQMRETTLNPGAERLVQVTIEDAQDAARHILLLMGNNAAARKEWIMATWE